MTLVEKTGRRMYLEHAAKDKKIIIYGALASGQVIYKEIMEREWGEIVAVVDRDADVLVLEDMFQCPLLKPDCLFDGLEWDYVYLGTSSPNARKEIKKYLMENGTREEQILFFGEECFFDGVNEYRISDDPEKLVCQIIQANENLKGDTELTQLFEQWVDEYYAMLTDKDSFIRRLQYEFLNHPSVDTRIVLGLYLYDLNLLDSDGMRHLVSCVSELPDEQREYMYFLCNKIAYMELYQNKVLYKGLGPDRKVLWKRVADLYCSGKEVELNMAVREEGKIAVLVPIISFPNTSSIMIIYREIAHGLCKEGKQVKIFAIPYGKKESFGFKSVADGDFYDQTGKCIQAFREIIDSRVEIEFIEEKEVSNLLNMAIDRIIEFKPQCIIDITDQICPVSAILHKYYPILCYAVRSCTMGTFFQKTTVGLFEYNEEVAPYQVILPYLNIKNEAMCSYNKLEKLDVPEDSFVVVTVGVRLSQEVDRALLEQMTELLKAKRNIYWALVGGDDALPPIIAKLDEEVIKKIRILVYEEDLAALYKLCDVFLNPDRAGGGFSMMFAMQQGVAVAALKKNLYGGAKRVGEAELIDGGYEELCRYVERLYDSPQLLVETKERMRRISQEKDDIKNWVSALCDILNEMDRSFIKES